MSRRERRSKSPEYNQDHYKTILTDSKFERRFFTRDGKFIKKPIIESKTKKKTIPVQQPIQVITRKVETQPLLSKRTYETKPVSSRMAISERSRYRPLLTESKFEKVEIYEPKPRETIVEMTETIISSPVKGRMDQTVSSINLRSLSKNSRLNSTIKNLDKIQTPRRGMFKRTSSLSYMNPNRMGMFSRTSNLEELSRNDYSNQYKGAHLEGSFSGNLNTSEKKYQHYREY